MKTIFTNQVNLVIITGILLFSCAKSPISPLEDISTKNSKYSEYITFDETFNLNPVILDTMTRLNPDFVFSSTRRWSVDKFGMTPLWVNITDSHGLPGENISLPVYFDENKTDKDRVIQIYLASPGQSYLKSIIFNITQKAAFDPNAAITYDRLFPLTQTISATTTHLNPDFIFNSTKRWSVDNFGMNPSWVNITDRNGLAGENISLPVYFDENNTGEDRITQIYLASPGQSYLKSIIFNITQLAK